MRRRLRVLCRVADGDERGDFLALGDFDDLADLFVVKNAHYNRAEPERMRGTGSKVCAAMPASNDCQCVPSGVQNEPSRS